MGGVVWGRGPRHQSSMRAYGERLKATAVKVRAVRAGGAAPACGHEEVLARDQEAEWQNVGLKAFREHCRRAVAAVCLLLKYNNRPYDGGEVAAGKA